MKPSGLIPEVRARSLFTMSAQRSLMIRYDLIILSLAVLMHSN